MQVLSPNKIKILTIDLETSNLDPWHNEIILIGYRFNSDGPVTVIKVCNGELPGQEFLNALADETIPKRGHNVHFDLLCLVAHGYTVNGILDDTRTIAYTENPSQPLDLKSLTRQRFGRKVIEIEDFGKKLTVKQIAKRTQRHPLLMRRIVEVGYTGGSRHVSINKLASYNQDDIINCDDLKKEFISTAWYRDIEQPLSKILFDSEVRGAQLDISYLYELKKEFEGKINEYSEKLKVNESFNPASPKQVLARFKERGINLTTTDKHTLKLLSWQNDEFASNLLEFRKFSKLLGTYVIAFLEQSVNGKIHGRFNQAGRETEDYGDVGGTATGRLSSSDPNLQNISDRTKEGLKVRKAFIASPGFTLIDSDLKQIQPRLIGSESQDPILIKAFNEGLDTHALMGSRIFNKKPEELTKEERQIGKTSWLALIFGSYPEKLKLIVERDSEVPIYYKLDFYEKIQQSFWSNSPVLRRWRECCISEARSQGFIKTYGGRIIKIPELASRNQFERRRAERLAVNYKIQGSEADILKLCLIQLAKIPGYRLIAPVHDEALSEFDSTIPEDQMWNSVTEAMESTCHLKNVPILADTKVIKDWSEK